MNDYNKKYLTRFNIFSFSASGFGQNMIIGVVNSYILYFYIDIFLIPTAAVTTLIFVARVFDAINDPIMGNIVDRTRTKWGKLRPYLFASILPLGVITSLLFYAPELSTAGKIIYAYITYIGFDIIYTVCDVPFWGLASAMTPNPKERIWFISFSRLFHSIGGALPVLIMPLFIKLAGNNLKSGYFIAGITIGIIGAALFSLSFFGTKERCNLDDKKPTFIDNIKFFMINKPLQIVIFANIIGFSRAISVVAGMYIATYLLGNGDLNIFVIGAWGVAGFLGMILTPILANIFNYKKLYVICAVMGIFSSILLSVLGYSRISIIVCLFLSGFPYGIISNINYAMIADSVDYVEWKTGQRTEGFSISFQTLMNKLMTALQGTVVALTLTLIGFKQPVLINREIVIQLQDQSVLDKIFLMITAFPAAGWILCVIPMMKYDFIGEKRELAHKELIERRIQAGIDKENK